MKGHAAVIAVIIAVLALCACGGDDTARQAKPLATTPTTVTVSTTPQSAPEPTGSAWIKLTPDSGPPGTAVTLTGYLPQQEPPAGKRDRSTGVLCWDGCTDGALTFLSGVIWPEKEPGKVSATFTVPSIPWLDAGKIRNPSPGDYPVGVVCIGVVKMGCIDGPSLASTTFHMTDGPARTCNPRACASITLSRSTAAPGDVVKVSGWAPLVGTSSLNIQLISPGASPQRYDVAPVTPTADGTPSGVSQASKGTVFGVTRAPDGTFSGSFAVPLNPLNQGILIPGSYTVALEFIPTRLGRRPPPGIPVVPEGEGQAFVLAQAPIDIAASSSWMSLAAGMPLEITSSAPVEYPASAVDADPSNSARMARCATAGITISNDAGASWHTVPLDGVDDAAAAEGFALANPPGNGEGHARCLRVTLDPAHQASLYAIFPTSKTNSKTVNAPFDLGFYSTDGGSTWTAAPVPANYAPDDFGGFRVVGDTVEAIFAKSERGNLITASFVAERTADGGKSWQPGHLACPASGPCVIWGPAPAEVYPYGWQQMIYYSTDGGQTWAEPDSPIGVGFFSHQATLVALSSSTVVLLSPSSQYPIEVSTDGGRTWRVTTLPPILGVNGASGVYVDLLMLPNGALLALPLGPKSWELLSPGAKTWCQVSSTRLPPIASGLPGLVAAGNQLWWLDGTAKPPAGLTAFRTTPISGLGCGGS